MGTSIYYTATRPSPMSDAERADVDRIVAEQNDGFPFDYEVLYFGPVDAKEPERLLYGSTKITMELSASFRSDVPRPPSSSRGPPGPPRLSGRAPSSLNSARNSLGG